MNREKDRDEPHGRMEKWLKQEHMMRAIEDLDNKTYRGQNSNRNLVQGLVQIQKVGKT